MACIGLLLAPITALAQTADAVLPLVPWPQKIEQATDSLALSGRLVVAAGTLLPLAQVTAEEVQTLTGSSLTVAEGAANAGDIELRLDDKLQPDHYTLRVNDRVTITGGDYNGVALGTATLLQLVRRPGQGLVVPQVAIDDHPHFAYCGAMLDVARQPYSLETLRQVVQICRFYKIRYLHLHLTDDSAWVFPSTAFPELGKHNRNAFGGAAPVKYSLEELKALVAYADARGVTLVPELEVPGHSGQLVGTLPEIFGAKDAAGQPLNIGMINVGNPRALEALDTLIGEMCDVFRSSPYFHTGGDEVAMVNLEKCPQIVAFAAEHKLEALTQVQNPLQHRLHEMVTKRGKQMIVWDGAHTPRPLPKDMIFMPWQHETTEAARLVKEGYRVINAPWGVRSPYINPYQCNGALLAQGEPLLIGATSILWELSEDRAVPFARHLAALRNEPTYNPDHNPGYASFIRRLSVTDGKVDRLLYGFSFNSAGLIDPTAFMRLTNAFTDRATLTLELPAANQEVRYTTDGSDPTIDSPLLDAPISLNTTTTIKARRFDRATRQAGPLFVGEFKQTPFVEHAAIGAKVTALPELRGSYVGGGLPSLVDGYLADGDDYTGAGWAGWLSEDFELNLDLGQAKSLERCGARFARGRLGLTLPKAVEFFASQDGQNYTSLGAVDVAQGGRQRGWYEIKPTGMVARYLRLKVTHTGDWTFVDEVAVNYEPLPPTLRHAAQGKPVTLAAAPDEAYGLPGLAGLTDGYVARSTDFMNPYWLGTEGRDVEATIDMGKEIDIHRVGLRALRYLQSGIYFPQSIDVLVSNDGQTFNKVGEIAVPPTEQREAIAKLETKLSEVRARYIKFIARQQTYWTFIDEIFVNPVE